MLKRIVVAAALTGLVAGVALPVQIAPAFAGKSGCREMAKSKFAGDKKMRRAFEKDCKTHWKAHKSTHGKMGHHRKKKG
jgi:hypothetical protein